jgi:Mrp family chromosome partitioning ATPase
MARMMDTLKQQGETPLARAGVTELPAASVPATIPAPVEIEPFGGMLFIEVGGKGQPMTASPEVLACGRQSLPGPAAPNLVPIPATAAPGTLTVALEPLPAAAPAEPRLAPELLVYHQPEHPVSKQYHALRESLLGEQPSGAAQILLFTAASAGVGTTTVLLNLAVSAAAHGARHVAVVDVNLARPAVAARLGLPATPGLREVLAGTAAPEQVLQPTAITGLYVLATAPGRRPSPSLTAEALRWLACWLRERFDVVFVDGPPWSESPELAALAVLADGIYPVLGQAEMAGPAVQQLLPAIIRRGGRLRGLLHAQRAA